MSKLNKSESNEQNSNEKKIFEILHKKEEISIISNNKGKFQKSKNSQIIQFKCFYCKNPYNNINRFETHMRLHVSYNRF